METIWCCGVITAELDHQDWLVTSGTWSPIATTMLWPHSACRSTESALASRQTQAAELALDKDY